MTTLASDEAFTPGSSLWFSPDLQLSSWTREMDWYLSFQIFRAIHHQSKPIPEGLQKVLQENDLPPAKATAAQNVLALVVTDRLPADNLILISAENTQEWLLAAFKIWLKAQKPLVRLFLPAGTTAKEVESVWKEHDQLSIVLNN